MFMSRPRWIAPLTFLVLLTVPCPALPCSLCSGNPQTTVTVRMAAAQARMVIFGTMAIPRLNPANIGPPGSGTTGFHIQQVLKNDPFLAGKQILTIPRYIPVDPKSPPRFVLFCDVADGKLDPYRGLPVTTAAALDYVRGAMALDPRNSTQMLLFFFRYLDHADPELANDAFIEFAKANDQQIGAVAARLSADRVRRLLADPKTPADRLALYAFLLGACGGPRDADLLRSLLDRPTERTGKALDGILGGYIQLRPREGWDLAVAILGDARRPFPDRFAALKTLRFYHAWKPGETRAQVIRGLAVMLDQGDIADMAVEDLRRWQMWDLTPAVLAQYGKKSHAAPIVLRAIVRYALSCTRPEAAQFVAWLRKQSAKDAEMVAEVQESLEFEKVK
jgi:hypothetical protein